MMQCKLANERQLEILEERQEDFLEHMVGWNPCRFCTPAYLRKLLRNVFDHRTEKNPHLCIHVMDGTHPAGHIYEGLKIESWGSYPEGETAGFTMDSVYYTFKLEHIVMVQVC